MPITRYRVPGHYLWAGLAALVFTGFSAWLSLYWPLCWIATALFLLSAALVLYLASRPPIEIYESHVKIGRSAVPWKQIRRLDRSANMPLMVRLTLVDKTRILVVYPGDARLELRKWHDKLANRPPAREIAARQLEDDRSWEPEA